MQSDIPHRPTYMEIDLDALARNFHKLSSFVKPARVMPVVKANAYGHGLAACAKLLESVGAPTLGVACLEEGIELLTLVADPDHARLVRPHASSVAEFLTNSRDAEG